MFQAFTILDVITDIMILLIPIYWTSKLQMSRKRKVGVCAIFLLGAVYVGSLRPLICAFAHQYIVLWVLELLAS